jgi:O-antigen/teichoic acid export membrane protein
MFPVMAQSQDNKYIVKDMLLRTISMGSLLMMPIMLGLAAIAEPLVSLLLTDKWLPSVVYMQLICMANVTVSLSSPNLVAIKSIGRSDVYMKLEVVRRVVMIVVLAISVLCFDSVIAIAIGYVLSLWLDYVIIVIPVKRLVGLSLKHQLSGIYKIMIASLLMTMIVVMIGKLDLQPWLLLCIQIPTGICVYVLFCYLLRIDSFNELLNKFKDL